MRNLVETVLLFLFLLANATCFQVKNPVCLPRRIIQHSRNSPTVLKADEECDIMETPYMTWSCDPDIYTESDRTDEKDLFSILNIWIPVVTPLLGFLLYEDVAKLFSWSIDVLGSNTWVAVDGGEYQAKIIAPSINGVVVPAIAVCKSF